MVPAFLETTLSSTTLVSRFGSCDFLRRVPVCASTSDLMMQMDAANSPHRGLANGSHVTALFEPRNGIVVISHR